MAGKPALFTIPGSNAAMTARLELRHKGIPYRELELPTYLHKRQLKALGFPRNTVPAMFMGRRRVQGSLEIARELERLRPDPPLFPSDPDQRARVEEIEHWAESEFQQTLRRVLPWAILQDPRQAASFLTRPPLPPAIAAPVARPLMKRMARSNGADEEAARRTLAELPGLLDRIDAWIAEGVIGGDEPNAADFQIVPTVRSFLVAEQLRPDIAERPVGQLALRLIPEIPGHVGPMFPESWLEGFRAARV